MDIFILGCIFYELYLVLYLNLFVISIIRMRERKLNDIWEQLAQVFNNQRPQKIAIVKVDCATEAELCSGT